MFLSCSTVDAAHLGFLSCIRSHFAFAAILTDGCVGCLDIADFGGDCSRVRTLIKNVHHFEASLGAFAAI